MGSGGRVLSILIHLFEVVHPDPTWYIFLIKWGFSPRSNSKQVLLLEENSGITPGAAPDCCNGNNVILKIGLCNDGTCNAIYTGLQGQLVGARKSLTGRKKMGRKLSCANCLLLASQISVRSMCFAKHLA